MARAKRSPAVKKAARPAVKAGSPRKAQVAELLAEWRARGIRRAKIGGFDLDGVLRGKYVSLEKLESALDAGFGFCDVIFGWDVADALYDNSRVTGWHTAYPDICAVLDPSTARYLPWEPDTVGILSDFRDADGGPHPACPRSLLKRITERIGSAGYQACVGVEFEFFFFRETRTSLDQKGFRGLEPLDPGMFGYSWVRSGQDSELMHAILDGMEALDIPIEGLHTETGPGVYEAAIRWDHPLRAADNAALFKTALKQIAHQRGLAVTFMAKWNADLPGCSGHLHASLWRDGKNAFFDPKRARSMSLVMQQFIAGQVALMQELTALFSPTINSYKRYVPGVWAPLLASWGEENRTAAVRVIGLGNAKAQRIEYRQTAADINPYVAIAGCLGAGLWGIEQKLPLPPEARGDAGTDGPLRVPRSLREATQALSTSAAARELFGEAFVDHYVRTRDWECRAYEAAVTDWELRRYFEVI